VEFADSLMINTLGNCSLGFCGRVVSDETIGSRKFWTVMQYLILHRDREIAHKELIDVMYPEGESDNPGNALKTLIHRIRSALDTLKFLDGRRMILNVRGAYKWNTEMAFTIDFVEFEKLCTSGLDPEADDDNRLSDLLEAIAIYKGHYLPKLKHEEWAAPVSAKYHGMFVNALHSAVDILEKQHDHERIIQICRHAVAIDPYDEYPYSCIIHGLVELEDNSAAMREYNRMSKLFYRQYGISPSNEIKKLYREIVSSMKNAETDLSIIQEDLNEQSAPTGAFFCEYETFKDIYRLEARSSERNGKPIHLGHIALEAKADTDPSLKTLNYYMDKLQDCISLSLRKGDIYAKYSISQFITLLPSNTYESANMVMERIAKRFHRENPRAPFLPDYSVRAMELPIG
jgi:DNA-binding SARP family transcriptional activator